MLSADAVRQLARRLSRAADRVTELTGHNARRAAEVTWDCPRGRRAVRRSGELAATARAGADELRAAAGELQRAAEDVDAAPRLLL
jgi:methyl-accepting chemotaxis protein